MKTKIRFLLMVVAELALIHNTLSCGGRTIMNNRVTDGDKQVILQTHNKFRQLVALGQVGNQPPAANMAKLQWSDALAQRAQQWAETCSSEIHDSSRHNGNNMIGQNIATKWTTRPPTSFYDMQPDWYNDAIFKWFNENNMYSFRTFRGAHTGHYTQLVWAQTTHVGCGFVFYMERNRYTKKYVCNYGPSGNVIGERPYQMGYPSCYSHGLVESNIFPGLCDGTANPLMSYNMMNFAQPYNNKKYYNSDYSNNYPYNNYPTSYPDYDTTSDYLYNVFNYLGYSHK